MVAPRPNPKWPSSRALVRDQRKQHMTYIFEEIRDEEQDIGTLLLSLIVSIHCLAQSAGSITGTVKDSQGNAIAGASVTVESAATSVRQNATTNVDGIFISPQLPPGVYVIRDEKSGFKSIEKSNVLLRHSRSAQMISQTR